MHVRKYIVAVLIAWICVVLSIPAMALQNNTIALNDVKVFFNGNRYLNQEAFYVHNNKLLAPMREVFEELGASVYWQQYNNTVIAQTNNDKISIDLNTMEIKVNGQLKKLGTKPEVINNRTYLPLRFVAESFNYTVDWNGRERVVSIIDLQPIIKKAGSYSYSSSNMFPNEFFKMRLDANKKLSIRGTVIGNKSKWLCKIEKYNNSILKEYGRIESNGYHAQFQIPSNLKDGDYKLSFYFKENGEKLFWSYYDDINLRQHNSKLYFLQSPVFANNYRMHLSNSLVTPSNYMQTRLSTVDNYKKMKKLALSITQGATSDYQKALMIHDWVASNIYYDMDAIYSGKYGNVNAVTTLNNKKSVCQGYAELVDELLKANGIPARLGVGYALGLTEANQQWKDVPNKSNHAWNEAYVDGRWIIMDVTWDSGNVYQKGRFKNGKIKHRYFDPSLEAFSDDHKIVEYR